MNQGKRKMGRGCYWTPAPSRAILALSRLRGALHRDACYAHLLPLVVLVEVRYVYVVEVDWFPSPPRSLEAAPYFALPDDPPDVRGVRVMEQNVIHPVPELPGQQVPATVEAPHVE